MSILLARWAREQGCAPDQAERSLVEGIPKEYR
jgi:hypothetical protein